MKKNKIRYWFPRILAIALNLFIALFALDSFSLPNWSIALLMHLVPNIIMALFTIIAWKYPVLGGVSWLLFSLLVLSFFHTLWLALPIAIIGIFFLTEQTKVKNS